LTALGADLTLRAGQPTPKDRKRKHMAERETIAATLAAALLQSMPSLPAPRPGQSPDVPAVCRHAVAIYETILGMLPGNGPSAR
jgi:hypothetical protein